jgi:hypothetical protein
MLPEVEIVVSLANMIEVSVVVGAAGTAIGFVLKLLSD